MTIRYEKQVIVFNDIRTVSVTNAAGEKEMMGLQVYYNKVYLGFAEQFIRGEIRMSKPNDDYNDDQSSQKTEKESITNKLLGKMQLNSPLKETLPSFLPEKIKTHSFSNFSYHPRSSLGGDLLISRSPDGMRRVLGVNQTV